MITTQQFQTKPDYYNSLEECEQQKYIKTRSNPRYSSFTQTHFTAGDEEQFETYRDSTNGNVCKYNISLKENIFKNIHSKPVWNKYKDIKANAVINTFRYIFYKFKKGIFVKIQNNQLKVFLPFSNSNFVNEWSQQINVINGNIIKYLKDISTLEGHRFNRRNIYTDIFKWYGNNCIFRYDKTEGDSNVSNVKNMLEELCANRHLPDIEFFINRRDFPIITKESYEPYNNIWDSKTKPLVSHNYEKYSPIFSMSKTNRYADILMPTWDDWGRVQSFEGKWFEKSCSSYTETFDTSWNNKKPTAVFRGGSTGCGVSIQTNPRLKLAYISKNTPFDENNIPYIDAGITKWNLRPRKIEGEPYLKNIDINNLGFGLVQRLTPFQQSKYKYIIHVQGHVSAFRLSLELSMKSVLLIVSSDWKLWYSDMLIPYIHYVPVKSDLSDLISQIKWCREHDDECKKIVKNAFTFYNTFLTKQGILDYMQKNIIDIKNAMGIYLYNFISPNKLEIMKEYNNREYRYPETNKQLSDISNIPVINRCYGLLQGIGWVINFCKDKFQLISEYKHLISQNKLSSVDLYKIDTQYFAVKKTNNKDKIFEHIHELFIGTKSINNLLKSIPNFAYIFGSYVNNNEMCIVSEYIQGQTLLEYINSINFNFNDFLFIILQICLSLQIAQNNCGFVHWDLTPWNIIIKKLPSFQSYDYMISKDEIYRVNTTLLPVIIDYGKSHVIYKEEHRGFINPYKMSTVQDILHLLLTSVGKILSHQKLSNINLRNLFKLINFISGTTYRRTNFSNVKEIKTFLSKTKNYSNIIQSNKYELENKTPLDLFKYIRGFDVDFNVIKTNEYINVMNQSNGRQVFEYILSNTLEEKLNSYINVFVRLKHCTIPQPKKLLFLYYTVQTIETNLFSVKNDMMNFLRSNNIPNADLAIHILSDSTRFLEHTYINKIKYHKMNKIKYDIAGDTHTLIPAPYNIETFLDPDKILYLIQPYQNKDLSKYKDIIDAVCTYTGKYQISEKHKLYLYNNFRLLLNTNTLYMKNNNANIKTLNTVSQSIYSYDLKNLREKINEHINQENCSKAIDLLNKYKLILKSIKK